MVVASVIVTAAVGITTHLLEEYLSATRRIRLLPGRCHR